jgi:peptidoglycan pentaglycine glycine transferase (the first glycine)
MKVMQLSYKERDEWNDFAAREPAFALLQSWEWGEFKQGLGWKAYRIGVKDNGKIIAGAQMLIKRLPLGMASVAYIPRGPIGDWIAGDVVPILLSELHRVARSHRAIFLKIEPPLSSSSSGAGILKQYHFRPSPHRIQPRSTIILDLDRDLDDILGQMRQKTRQYIRKASREGITVRTGLRDDLPAFYDLMRMTSKRKRLRPRIRSYYEDGWEIFAEKNRAVLLMAFQRDRLLAVRMSYHFGSRAAEFHAGSVSDFGHLHPNYLLVWESIKWAKRQGCCSYDFWGIPDEIEQTDSGKKKSMKSGFSEGLWGVFRFKRGFCDDIVSYVGAYDYVYSPPFYNLTMNRFLGPKIMSGSTAFSDLL